MYTNIFDTHAHYDDERFTEDCDTLLSALPSKGVSNVVNCATDISSCEKSRILAEKFDFMYFAAGIHPHESEEADTDYIPKLKQYASHKKCVAIGEIGLDYHYDFSKTECQLEVFEKQLVLANELNLPVIVHDREAHADTLELLKKHKPKGILHCFSGSVETAKEILNLGMIIGLGGAVTFKNAKKPVEVSKFVPLDMLVLETDCPYMTPTPFRGQRNDSSFISYTAQCIAELRNIDTQEFLNITSENARRIFGI